MGGLMSKQPRAGADDGGRVTVSRLAEVGTLLTRLLAYLAPYRRGRFTAADGTVYETPYLLPVGGTTVTAITEHPLLCVSAATEALPRRVRVVAGGFNGMVFYVNATDGGPFLVDESPKYITAVNGGGYIYAKLTFALPYGGLIYWSLEAAATVPDAEEDVGYQPIAATYYTALDGLVIGQYVSGSQHVVRCPHPYEEHGAATYTFALV